ncbi:MAG: hypothetical protein NVS2B16_16680 [Chloroflexota bacterium]
MFVVPHNAGHLPATVTGLEQFLDAMLERIALAGVHDHAGTRGSKTNSVSSHGTEVEMPSAAMDNRLYVDGMAIIPTDHNGVRHAGPCLHRCPSLAQSVAQSLLYTERDAGPGNTGWPCLWLTRLRHTFSLLHGKRVYHVRVTGAGPWADISAELQEL